MKVNIKAIAICIGLFFLMSISVQAADVTEIEPNGSTTTATVANEGDTMHGSAQPYESDFFMLNFTGDNDLKIKLYLNNGSWNISLLDSKGNLVVRKNQTVSGNTQYIETSIDTKGGKGVYYLKIESKDTPWPLNYYFSYYNNKNGLYKENDKLMYYSDNLLKSGFQYLQISGYEEGMYYFDGANGAVNGFHNIKGNQFYFENYVQQSFKGWKTIQDKKYYFVDKAAVNGFQTIDYALYYFEDYALVNDGWKDLGGNKYYFEDGRAAYGSKFIAGEEYYFKDYIAVNGWVEIDGSMRYYQDYKAVNGFLTIDDSLYYFSHSIPANGFRDIDGKLYYFDNNKAFKDGFIKVGNDLYYATDYNLANKGWKNIDGEIYYFKDGEGNAASNGWRDIDGKIYYFLDCKMQKGLVKIGDEYFNFLESGAFTGVATNGWYKKTNNEWLYLRNGKTVNGWQSIEGLQYYFENEEMVHDWFLDENTGTWYFFNGGVMQRKDISINGVTYLFDKDGIWRGYQPKWFFQDNNYYYKDEWNRNVTGWKAIDGLQYKFNDDGTMVRDWYLDTNTQTWYFFNGGAMQRENIMINGKLNIFDKDGIWRGVKD